MAGTIADSGTAVADITATSTCRTESDSEYSGTMTAKATFTCGTTGTETTDGTVGKTGNIPTKEEITLGGNCYSVDKLIGNGGEAEVYVVSSAKGNFVLKLYRRGNGVSKDILKRLERLKGGNRGYS